MALQIEVQSNTRQARSDLARLNKSVDNISTTTTNMANKLQKSVTILTAGIAGLVAAKGLVKITDQFTLVENRIALVTGRTKELNKTFKELQEVSIRSRGSLEGIADLYNRIGRSTKSLGVSNQDVIKVTETIQKAIVISG
uniref:tape measure protein n=1 Tax=Planktomarina sp. TaxID=2024851 RepID=UPI003261727B